MLARNVSDLSEKFRNSYFPENLAAIKLLAKSEQKFPIKAAVFRSTPASFIFTFCKYTRPILEGGEMGVMVGFETSKEIIYYLT